jgi:virulence-associated protein VagC
VIEEAPQGGALAFPAGTRAPTDMQFNEARVDVANADAPTLEPVAEATEHAALVPDRWLRVAELRALVDERVDVRPEQAASVTPQGPGLREVLLQHVSLPSGIDARRRRTAGLCRAVKCSRHVATREDKAAVTRRGIIPRAA